MVVNGIGGYAYECCYSWTGSMEQTLCTHNLESWIYFCAKVGVSNDELLSGGCCDCRKAIRLIGLRVSWGS